MDLEQPPNHVIFSYPIGLPNGGMAFIYSGYGPSDYLGGMPNLVNRFLWVSPSLNPYEGGAVDEGDIFLTNQASSPDGNFIVYDKEGEVWFASTSKPYQPFKLTDGSRPAWQPGKPSTPAVLLVHGCGGDAETWNPWIENKTFVSLLEVLPFTEISLYEGVNEDLFPDARVFVLDYRKVQNPLEDLSEIIPKALDKIKELTGDSKVDIITHSMGATLTRFYLEDLLPEKASVREDVGGVLMLAPPNQGAWISNYLSSRIIRLIPNVGVPIDLSCEQFKELGPKSDTIKMLNSHALLGGITYYEVAAGSRFYYIFVGKTDPWIATGDTKLPDSVLPDDVDYVYREIWAAHSNNVALEVVTSYLGEPIIGIIVHPDTLEEVKKFYQR
ncbi:hypothetical protein A3K78_02985 [Candidatus Bathyarchaeota archaeon RBG_13_52_12]|nr:MAG: hypothetical protein A3K78_02985 [Candidatus Bathyarchaeota archaeon RBG_13_52_12]